MIQHTCSGMIMFKQERIFAMMPRLYIKYSENPISLAYSANKLIVAMCLICIEFKAADRTIIKGAITFLSEDRNIPINRFNNLNTGCLKSFVKNFTVHETTGFATVIGVEPSSSQDILLHTCFVQQKITS